VLIEWPVDSQQEGEEQIVECIKSIEDDDDDWGGTFSGALALRHARSSASWSSPSPPARPAASTSAISPRWCGEPHADRRASSRQL